MDTTTLNDALAVADAAGTVREAAAALRQRYSALRIVVVDAIDMRHDRPAAVGTRRQLHLGASDGHCWAVTTDAASASGLFVSDRG